MGAEQVTVIPTVGTKSDDKTMLVHFFSIKQVQNLWCTVTHEIKLTFVRSDGRGWYYSNQDFSSHLYQRRIAKLSPVCSQFAVNKQREGNYRDLNVLVETEYVSHQFLFALPWYTLRWNWHKAFHVLFTIYVLPTVFLSIKECSYLWGPGVFVPCRFQFLIQYVSIMILLVM